MTPKQLKSIQARIETALAERRYSVALIELKSMAEASGASWEIRMEVEHVGSTYRMLPIMHLTVCLIRQGLVCLTR